VFAAVVVSREKSGETLDHVLNDRRQTPLKCSTVQYIYTPHLSLNTRISLTRTTVVHRPLTSYTGP
jgi:hypothetical protein